MKVPSQAIKVSVGIKSDRGDAKKSKICMLGGLDIKRQSNQIIVLTVFPI